MRGCILICYLNLALSTSNWNSDSKIWYIFDMNNVIELINRNIIFIEHRAQQNVADIHCIWHWVNYYSCCTSRLSLVGYSRAAIPKNYFSVQESKHWLFPFDIFGYSLLIVKWSEAGFEFHWTLVNTLALMPNFTLICRKLW